MQNSGILFKTLPDFSRFSEEFRFFFQFQFFQYKFNFFADNTSQPHEIQLIFSLVIFPPQYDTEGFKAGPPMPPLLYL